MSALLRIISGVMYWDSSEFKKTADKIEKSKAAPSSKHLKAIRKHAQGPREKRLEIRQLSIQSSKSIIFSILDDAHPNLSCTLTETQHHECLQYYAAHLSTRDRDVIVNTFCRQTPDLLTQAVRDVVGVYEPMIRNIHDNIDLAEHLDAAKAFIEDLIAVSSSRKVSGEGRETAKNGHGHRDDDGAYELPTVEDYVDLLHRHKGSVYKWLHHVSNKCPEVRDMVKEWAQGAAEVFRAEGPSAGTRGDAFTHRLQLMFASLPKEQQDAIRPVLDKHSDYLDLLHGITHARVQTILDKAESSTSCGPGMYLASWQSLLDESLVSPGFEGNMRKGKDVINRITPGKPGVGGETAWDGSVDVTRAMEEIELEERLRPDGKVVVDALGQQFHELLREVAKGAVRDAWRRENT